jgi:hypothetical protein
LARGCFFKWIIKTTTSHSQLTPEYANWTQMWVWINDKL